MSWHWKGQHQENPVFQVTSQRLGKSALDLGCCVQRHGVGKRLSVPQVLVFNHASGRLALLPGGRLVLGPAPQAR